MTDLSMFVYLEAKKDNNFLNEIKEVLGAPDDEDAIAKKESFANCYATWLIAKGKWADFVRKNAIEL
jgi:hypothetical protein